MQKREKMLAIVFGALMGVLALWFVASQISDAFAQRQSLLDDKKLDLAKQKNKLREADATAKRLADYERRSLPSSGAVAQTLYQSWVSDLLAKSGFEQPSISANSQTGRKSEHFEQYSFIVKGDVRLPGLVRFLYDFYRGDHLQQIRNLTVTPKPKSRSLGVVMTIEALSMTTATRTDKLNEIESTRLALSDVDAYQQAISDRNLFGPPNQPPTISSLDGLSVRNGQTLSADVRARDPDAPLDAIAYELVAEKLPGAKIDPKTGKISWRAPADFPPGKYDVVVRVTDDGHPPKSVEKTASVSVEPYGLKIASISSQTVVPDKPLEIAVKLSESDPTAKVRYELDEGAPEGAEIDAESGKISWTPDAELDGKTVTLAVKATDDRTPPRSDRATVSVKIAKPVVPPLVLDFAAKNTFLTAIIESSGERVAWLIVRPQGKTLKVRVGDVFQAGNFEGKVEQISRSEVVIRSSAGLKLLSVSKSLADAAELPDSGL